MASINLNRISKEEEAAFRKAFSESVATSKKTLSLKTWSTA